jgi:hypothetical protein
MHGSAVDRTLPLDGRSISRAWQADRDAGEAAIPDALAIYRGRAMNMSPHVRLLCFMPSQFYSLVTTVPVMREEGADGELRCRPICGDDEDVRCICVCSENSVR